MVRDVRSFPGRPGVHAVEFAMTCEQLDRPKVPAKDDRRPSASGRPALLRRPDSRQPFGQRSTRRRPQQPELPGPPRCPPPPGRGARQMLQLELPAGTAASTRAFELQPLKARGTDQQDRGARPSMQPRHVRSTRPRSSPVPRACCCSARLAVAAIFPPRSRRLPAAFPPRASRSRPVDLLSVRPPPDPPVGVDQDRSGDLPDATL
jgi:hypothetical protein